MEEALVSITLIQPTATNTPFPQHAKNYMDKEPKLPTPLDDPEDVAEAIVNAAVKPTRSKKVGAMSKRRDIPKGHWTRPVNSPAALPGTSAVQGDVRAIRQLTFCPAAKAYRRRLKR